MEIVFVTGNEMKLKSCIEVFKDSNINIINEDIKCPEMQFDTIEEVAIQKAKYAYSIIKKPLIINDCGLIIPALNDFPGPYTKYVENTIKEDGILNLMKDKKDRYTYYLDVLVYIDKEIKIFKSVTPGSISLEKEGTNGYGYDKIFIPKDMEKPLACYSDDEILKVWMNNTYKDFYEYVKKELSD